MAIGTILVVVMGDVVTDTSSSAVVMLHSSVKSYKVPGTVQSNLAVENETFAQSLIINFHNESIQSNQPFVTLVFLNTLKNRHPLSGNASFEQAMFMR